MTKKDQLKTLTPKRRFPEFRDAAAWETEPLANFVASLDAGVSVLAGDRVATNAEAGVLKTSCVTDGTFDPTENKVVPDSSQMKRLQECVRADTILISRMNTVVLVGANAYVDRDIDNLFLPDRLWAAKGTSRVYMRFLAYVLGAGKGRDSLRAAARGTSGSMKNISKADVLELQISAPGIAEQRKIAACLTSLDEWIAAEGRKLEALRAHKQGLMQQLFPQEGESHPRLRFPEFRDAGDWARYPLGDLCRFVRGPFGGALKKEIFVSEGYAVYEQAHAIDNVMRQFRYFITKEKYEEMKRFEVRPNDLIMSCSGTMGKFAQVSENPVPGVINQALLKLTVNRGWNSKFILLLLELPNTQSKLLTQSAGGAMKNVVGVPQLKAIELLVPSEAEQQRIAECLSSLDALIDTLSAKLDALRTHKKGLMQQLFPSPEGI